MLFERDKVVVKVRGKVQRLIVGRPWTMSLASDIRVKGKVSLYPLEKER